MTPISESVPETRDERRAYDAPQLVELGDVKALTNDVTVSIVVGDGD